MPILQRMNSRVYLYRPVAKDAAVQQTNSPSLIMMFGWMDGRLQHEQKVIDALHRRHPSATILLVKSSLSDLFMTQTRLETLLSPAIDIICSRYWDGILMHMFSNGGGFMFVVLHKALTKREQLSPGVTMQIGSHVVCVFDSLPGDRALRTLLALAAPKSPLLYILSVPVIAAVCGVWELIHALHGNPPLFQEYRRTLLAPSLLPSITHPSGSQSRRLYIYSVKDHIIRYEDVERHIKEAERIGLVVDAEKYEHSQHIGHMRCDEKRYWDAVDSSWARAKL
ncbi:hypothetical protein PENSPDRAFT_662824 [Peniophora sp. CONT]|nr:hypothetical protein PENSPDRAFT_662824 [Peniophora sp. CONT]